MPGVFAKPRGGPVSPAIEEEVGVLRTLTLSSAYTDWDRAVLQSLIMVNRSERAGYLTGLVKGLAEVGLLLDYMALFRLSELFLRRAVSLAEPSQDPDLLSSAYSAWRIHGWSWDARVENTQRGAEACRKAGNLHGWGFCLWAAALAQAYRGDFARALTQAEELVRTAQDGGDLQLVSWGLQEQGRAQRWRGHWEEAALALKQSQSLADAVPDRFTRVEVRGQLAQLYLQQGQMELGPGRAAGRRGDWR